jgi:hypothetical protein
MCDQVAQCRFVTEATVRTSPMNLSDPRFGKHALNTIAQTIKLDSVLAEA